MYILLLLKCNLNLMIILIYKPHVTCKFYCFNVHFDSPNLIHTN